MESDMSDTAPAQPRHAEHAPLPAERRWIRLVPWMILALVIASVVLVSVRWDSFESDRTVQSTDNATIQGDTAVIDAKVSGYVSSVNFKDFQSVRAGDLLVQLDDREYRANVLHAEAALAKAQAILANLDHEVAAQRAMIAQARANADSSASKVRLAIDDDRRFAALADSGAVTGQEADSARSNAAVFRAGQAGSLAAVDLANRQRDVLEGQRAQREADVLAARAALDSAQIALSYTRIVAPAAGTIGQRLVQPGSLLNPGAAVVTFVARTQPYVVANYKETQLARIAPGQAVEIMVDSFPGDKLRGRVSRLAPASGATFATLPADNATGNFTKVAQRIPLRIDLLPNQPLIKRLRAGMSVTTRIDTRG
jgi:membrane fusion protein (multidrug efflux system)